MQQTIIINKYLINGDLEDFPLLIYNIYIFFYVRANVIIAGSSLYP